LRLQEQAWRQRRPVKGRRLCSNKQFRESWSNGANDPATDLRGGLPHGRSTSFDPDPWPMLGAVGQIQDLGTG